MYYYVLQFSYVYLLLAIMTGNCNNSFNSILRYNCDC